MASHTLSDAVLRNPHTMSESAQRLSERIRALYPGVEWRLIGAFRNVLVHDYLGVDLDQIWRIVQTNVRELTLAVSAMPESLGPED